MRTTTTEKHVGENDAPATDFISYYEIFLLCSAAFLLAVAYPAKEPIAPQSLPVVLPITTDEPVQLEASNHYPQLDSGTEATVMLERLEADVITEIPASKPTS